MARGGYSFGAPSQNPKFYYYVKLVKFAKLPLNLNLAVSPTTAKISLELLKIRRLRVETLSSAVLFLTAWSARVKYCTGSTKSRPVKHHAMAPKCKKRKISDENRRSQELWEKKYLVEEDKGNVLCLVYKESISCKKEYNIRRHYDTKHKSNYHHLSDAQKATKVCGYFCLYTCRYNEKCFSLNCW